MEILKNISLKKYNTFKIGGRTKFFCVAKDKEDIVKAITLAGKQNLPFFILGAGSNLLISDKGFSGLIIKMQNTNYKLQNTKIFAGAGAKLAELLNVSVKNELAGLEWAIGIPGTVGGAIFGNAGAFGKSMKNIIGEVKVFNIKTGKIESFKNKKCEFGSRKSIFKKNRNLIILSAEIRLKKDDKKNIKSRLEKFLEHRRESQPLDFPSAGSVFMNPNNFSAGKLIENCGLKGKRIGSAEISKKHANFIVNLGEARAKDVIKLINLAKKSVKNKFHIILEEEIQYFGF